MCGIKYSDMSKKLSGELPVMKAHCRTCPFRPVGDNKTYDPELAQKVITRNFLSSQQVCHGSEGPNREHRNRCKGAFDYFKEIYYRMGMPDVIQEEPMTREEIQQKAKEYGNKNGI